MSATESTRFCVRLYPVGAKAAELAMTIRDELEGCRSVERDSGSIAFVFDGRIVDEETAGIRVWGALDRHDFHGEHLEPPRRLAELDRVDVIG